MGIIRGGRVLYAGKGPPALRVKLKGLRENLADFTGKPQQVTAEKTNLLDRGRLVPASAKIVLDPVP